MCGIVGIVSTESNINIIEDLTTSIKHRGPDDFGFFHSKNISLGHRRLSIQDLSANGHQPMFSDDKKYVILFNGEIYNHWEIRQAIAGKYPFKSTSDTETVLYGFIEYGTKIFSMLNGIFALAIYDTSKNELFVARDQFGLKPLYYYQTKTQFLFSSELKSISSIESFDSEIDLKAIVNYINFLWSPGERTPFAQVKKLLPGHFLKLNVTNPSKISIEKYYEVPFDGTYSAKTEIELIEELDQRLLKAVDRQLLSDVPVGFFLSGGLDSSAVVAMAKRLRPNEKLSCYTIDTGSDADFEGFSNDLHYAKIVAAHLDVDLHVVKANVDILRDFDKMIYHLDEPQADAAPLNVLNICRAARANGHIVLLGGTAGDDLFSGYRRHQAIEFERYFKFIPAFAVSGLKFLVGRVHSQNSTLRRIRKLVYDLDKPKAERLAGYFNWLPLKITKNLFKPSIQESIKNYNPSAYLIDLLNSIPKEKSDLNKMLFWEMKTFLPDHNLNYTDKMSMAEGVEVRVPFLDLELVEFSTKIPPTLKLKGKTTKYLLKKVMERYLPMEVIYRPKAGFGAPVRSWINNDLSILINTYLSKESIENRNIFDYNHVQALLRDNKAGKIDAAYPIWALLAIESWLRQFVDQPLHDNILKNYNP